jgi:hypothetical protein
MAITEKRSLWFFRSESGSPPPTRTVQIKTGQGIYMSGAPFYANNTGTVTLSASTKSASAANTLFTGLAVDGVSASLAANTSIRISVLRSTDVYAVYIDDGTDDLAAAQNMVGDQYGLTVSTSAGEIGYTTLDTDETSTGVAVEVVDILSNIVPEKYDTSTAPGVALVRFLPVAIEGTKA